MNNHSVRPPRSLLVAFCLALALGGAPCARANEETRSIMHGVFDAIAYLLPLSVRDAQLASKWDRELINEKLDVLRKSADALAEHGKGRNQEFHLLANSFDETVRDIDASFKEEWPSYAYFSLMELTQHCVACHSQQKADARQEFAQRLLARVNTEIFDPTELAQLYIATRQFDAAMSTLERKLLAPTEDAIDLDIAGIPVDYLAIALGVGAAPARADQFLERFAGRPDAPYYLKRRVSHWRERISALTPVLQAPADLATARRLFTEASAGFRVARDRAPAVDDLVTATVLRRYLDAHPSSSGPEAGEVFYMLGVIALRSMEPKYSVPEMEALFASAIKADPKGTYAEPSYALLEEFGYVRDVHLARAEADTKVIDMRELRRLIGAPVAR